MLHAQLAKAYQRLAQLSIVERTAVYSRDDQAKALQRAKLALADSNLVKTNLDLNDIFSCQNYKQLLDIFETLVIMRDKLSVFEDWC